MAKRLPFTFPDNYPTVTDTRNHFGTDRGSVTLRARTPHGGDHLLHVNITRQDVAVEHFHDDRWQLVTTNPSLGDGTNTNLAPAIDRALSILDAAAMGFDNAEWCSMDGCTELGTQAVPCPKGKTHTTLSCSQHAASSYESTFICANCASVIVPF